MGSANLLSSCNKKSGLDVVSIEHTITQQADSLVHVKYENGNRTLLLEAPILEQYGLAKEPYIEFREGVSFTTYEDSTLTVASTLIADYAILFETQELWEAKGNVVVTNADGRVLKTEQLFWNQKLEMIYSNVESEIIDGDNIIIGIGFESDQEFKEYKLRRPKGRLLVDAEPTFAKDTIQVDTTVIEIVD